ncbi:exocyst complex component EXO70I-like [Rosa sericea]
MATKEEDSRLSDLQLACTDLRTLLKASALMEQNLKKMDYKFNLIDETLTSASRRVAPLQSMSMASRALETRINRAVTPALALLDNFKRSESIQDKLLDLSSKLSNEKNMNKRLKTLIKYVDCVDQLKAAITSICEEGEPVIQRLQEVVEFLSRTKATDQYRIHRLRETLITLKALYETEVDAMRFEGLLDEALLNLQDEYENILQQIKHQNIVDQSQAVDKDNEGDDQMVIMGSNLGTELEIELLRRISQTLAAEDCLDICIDIYVKVRYRRVAKALMRLNPEYLRTHSPEEIDEMAWENLETAITLWIQHFELAVKAVLVSEKNFCEQVLGGIMDGLVWPECFVKIADKIMAVFFRFGEGVARSSKEPQKLFKLLDMFESLEKLKPAFSQVFEGEAGTDICVRFRELEKLLIHASSKVFWEFGLQIEGNSDGVPPPQDGSVPKIVRYAVNYMKYLATEAYSVPMARVLRTEQIWKAGILSRPESDENLLRDAVSHIMEALQRNVEAKRSGYRVDKLALPHVFAMNTYWYIYMRTKNTELGKLVGDQYMKKNYKVIAEESAYMYQKIVWVPLVRVLEKDDDLELESKEAMVGMVRAKMEAFMKGLDDVSKRHKGYYSIPDEDLREQIRLATVKLVVPAYSEFLDSFSVSLPGKSSYLSPESVQELLCQIFEGGEVKLKRRGSRDRTAGGSSAVDGAVKGFRRTRSNTSEK